ncbi:hypothetical protein Avbf_11126 [Armadillidium vulgare]|nr:hypothetical protein Avbf_11126 [Armadillidium vulgare]
MSWYHEIAPPLPPLLLLLGTESESVSLPFSLRCGEVKSFEVGPSVWLDVEDVQNNFLSLCQKKNLKFKCFSSLDSDKIV